MTKLKLITIAVCVLLLTSGGIWLRAQERTSENSLGVQTQQLMAQSLVDAGAARPTAATPIVGTPTASPTVITANTPTTVTVTAQITNPTLIPGSVNLLRLGATGTQPTILGVMHDDGLNDDAVAGDQVFTIQVAFNELSVGQINLQVSAAFKGRLQRVLSLPLSIPIWNVVQPPAGSGLNFSVPYPSTWTAEPASNAPSDGLYLTDSSEEESGHGISVALLNGSLDSVAVDSSYVLISKSSQTINGKDWVIIIQQEPDGGLRFYDAFLQTPTGVLVVGGNDSSVNESTINMIIRSINP